MKTQKERVEKRLEKKSGGSFGQLFEAPKRKSKIAKAKSTRKANITKKAKSLPYTPKRARQLRERTK